MARFAITTTAPLPQLPLSLYDSHAIGYGTIEPFGVCDIVVGLDSETVTQLVAKSLDTTDEALAHTSDSIRFLNTESYESWFGKSRTSFALIDRVKNTLMALVWIGPSPLTMKSSHHIPEIPHHTTDTWNTMAYRSYTPYRGAGFMTSFVQYILERYQAENPHHRLWVEIDAKNNASIALAKKLEFVEIPEVRTEGKLTMIL